MDWPERLFEGLARAILVRPETYPCVVWAADCVLLMTDVDLMPERDDTAAACYARMRRDGSESVREAIGAKLKEIPLAFARRGDVVLASGDIEAVGICCGERSAFVALQGRLSYRPTLAQLAAFAVPFGD